MPGYFRGWYMKCQSDSQTLALIPAVHEEKGKKSCSLQIITDDHSWNLCFPFSSFQESGERIRLERNEFGSQGILLDLQTPELTAAGAVSFGKLTPLHYDIMGPFRYVPFLECRHSVMSMKHTVTGELTVNGVPYRFRNADGYWEGDRGRSFPREYAWTQCSFPAGSIMLSVARIPIGGFHFTGIIGFVLLNGQEYRLATYLGAKLSLIRDGEIIVRQGRRSLRAKLLDQAAQPLQAPLTGAMVRTIHEHPSCRAFYCFQENGRTLLSFEATNASFEYEYPF